MNARTDRSLGVAVIFGLITGLGHGFFYFGASAFLKPWVGEFAISRTQAAAAISLGRLNAGWMTLVAGGLADRLGSRYVASMGCALAAAGLAFAALCETPGQLAFAWGGLAGIGMAMAFTVVLDKAMMDIYPPHMFGRAVGSRFAAVALGSFVSATLTGLIAHHFSWRVACAVWALVIGGCLVAVLLLIADRGAPGTQDQAQARGLTLRQALRVSDFWLITAVAAIQSGMQIGVVVHLAAMLTDAQLPAVHVAGLVGVMVLLSLPGRLAAGWVSDHLSPRHLARLVVVAMVVQALSLVWHGLFPSVASGYLFPLIYGLACGFPMPVLMLMETHRFGTRHFGAIQGSTLLVMSGVGVLVPLVLGRFFDLTGHYTWGLCLSAVVLLVAALLAHRLGDMPHQLHPLGGEPAGTPS